MTEIILSTQNGEPVASSRQIAESFGKEHKDVLEAIRTKTAENSALLEMFHLTEYTTKEKRLKKYEGRTGHLSADSVLETSGPVPQLRLSRSGSR